MTVLEAYNSKLDAEALREKTLAEFAREAGDARAQSIHLRKASMLGDML